MIRAQNRFRRLEMEKAVIYSRVSTRAQAEEGTSLESQQKACEKLAMEKGYEVGEVFKEDWPGDSLDRPELNRLRDLIRSDHVSAVLCHATDRLARNPIHLAIFAEECQKCEVELLFVTEPLDNSPEGQLIQYVKGFAAQVEREKIKERTMRGKHMRAVQGKLPQGTGKGIYGYRYDKTMGRRVVVQNEADVIRRMFRMAADGGSIHGIAKRLTDEGIPSFGGGRWHPLTVRRMLMNPVYTGRTYYGQTKRIPLGGRRRRLEQKPSSEWILIPDATPAIISIDEFNAANEELKKPKSRSGKAILPYLLRGHIFCAYCGSSMSGSFMSRRWRYYYCRKTLPDYAIPHKCEQRYVRAAKVEQDVWLKLSKLVKDPEMVLAELRQRREQAVPFLSKDIARIQRELETGRNQQKRLMKLYQYSEIDENSIVKQTRALQLKEKDLLNELARLQSQQASIRELENLDDKILEYCQRVSQNLDSLNFDEKRLLLDALEVKVFVYHDHNEVRGLLPPHALCNHQVTIARTSA
jgi:site-specific DNA recombinase